MLAPNQELQSRSFQRDGFIVARGLANEDTLAAMRAFVLDAIEPLQGPAEFEADVGYPGAPANRLAPGGRTPRRLLHAYSRAGAFKDWATGPAIRQTLITLFGDSALAMSQCHHNCVMTKHPGFSSATMWHQDVRYWSFDEPELISVWLALGPERIPNGALSVIPGSHRQQLDRGRLDRSLFLREDLGRKSSHD